MAASFAASLFGSLLEPSGWTEILFLVVSFAILFAVLSVVFYLAGAAVVGRSSATLKDAFAISVLGTLVLIVCISVFRFEIAVVLSLIAWLLLVRHYYETGFLGSIAVGLTSVIVATVILVALDMLFWNSGLVFSWLPFFQ